MKATTLILLLLFMGLTAHAQGISPARAKFQAADRGLVPTGYYVIIADEQAWKELKRGWHAESDAAFTNLAAHKIVLRESYVLSASPEILRHVLAHECGHIRTGSSSEVMAESWAREHI
jgi:hypothetical protein